MSNIKPFTNLAFLCFALACSIVNVTAETTTQTLYDWLPLELATVSGSTVTGFTQTISIAPIATGPSGIVTYAEYISFHYPSFGFEGPLDQIGGVALAQGPSYYAEDDTVTQINVIPTTLETTVTLPVPATTSKSSQSVITAQAVVPSISVSTIGTSSFTLTETFTLSLMCSSFSFSTPSATGSATPVAIAECVGQGVGFEDVPSATVSPFTFTRSMFGKPITTVVFDVATLSQGSGNSNGGGRSQGAIPMELQFSLFLTVMGVVLGGGMVLI